MECIWLSLNWLSGIQRRSTLCSAPYLDPTLDPSDYETSSVL